MSRLLARIIVLFAVISIAGESRLYAEDSASEADSTESVAAILSQPLPKESYGTPPRTCLSREQIRRMEVIDESAVMFYWSKGSETVWLSVLERPCRGLKQGQMIQMTQKRKTCPGDRFAGLRTGFSSGPGIDAWRKSRTSQRCLQDRKYSFGPSRKPGAPPLRHQG